MEIERDGWAAAHENTIPLDAAAIFEKEKDDPQVMESNAPSSSLLNSFMSSGMHWILSCGSMAGFLTIASSFQAVL